MQTSNKIPKNPIGQQKRGIIGWTLLPFQALWDVFSGIFWGIASLFGYSRPVRNGGHKYIDTSDVDHELQKARDLASGHDVVDTLDPAGVVLRYAQSSSDERAMIDLSALDAKQQDWLAKLSDTALYMISMTGRRSAEKSLEHRAVVLSFPKPERVVEQPEVLAIPEPEYEEGRPTKCDLQIIREGFREALTGTRRPYDYRPR